MQYLLLIYGDENGSGPATDEDRQKMYAEYGALSADLRATDRLISANELAAVSTATTVRVRDGESLVTDGPFAETKETLGGYYLVECDSLDEALEIATRIPSARQGSIEVRPVVQH
ncbi:MAG TPA: YciI family protein [Gaiellaceae bacterium]|nr:YciI family protein [Gaiellaceae bacterium]